MDCKLNIRPEYESVGKQANVHRIKCSLNI